MPSEKDKSESKKKEDKPSAQVTISLPSLTLDFGPTFQFRLALLGLVILLFGFSLFVFARSNFAISDIYDLPRLQFNISKLWSLTFVLFLALYSLSIALAAEYGVNLPKVQAAFPLFALVILAVVMSFFFTPYRAAFIAFAVALGACSIAASFYDKLSLGNAWSVTSKALTVLLILAFLFTFMRASSAKDRYFDLMLNSVTTQAPELIQSIAPAGAQQAVNLCADLIGSAQIKKEQVEAAFTRQEMADALERAAGPVYTALPASAKATVVDSAYNTSITKTVSVADKLKTDLSTILRKVDVGRQLQGLNVSSALTPATLKREILKVPVAKTLADSIPLLTALTVLSIVSVINFAIHILSTLFAWLLAKFVL